MHVGEAMAAAFEVARYQGGAPLAVTSHRMRPAEKEEKVVVGNGGERGRGREAPRL